MSFELADEYNTRVKHNFKRYVLLTSRNIHWRQEYILETIYGLDGYHSHKTVKYEDNSSHIHVKFEEEYKAKEAVDFLINLNSDLTAVLVDDMLRDWFNFERNCGLATRCTITIVDIIGDPPFGVNFLTEGVLHSVFRDFWNPYVLPYTAALNEPHVQVLFESMTEALAACVSFGEWCVRDRKMDSFFFRVRINPSENEALLISHSGGTPQEAFKLDYFVNLRNGSVLTTDAQCRKPNMSYNYFQNKGLDKFQTPRLSTLNIDPNQNILPANGNPIICVPIIAPFNSYARALMANKRMKAGATKVIPNCQKTRKIQGTEDEIVCLSSSQSENSVDCLSSVQGVNSETLNENGVSSEVFCTNLTLDSVHIQGKPDVIPPPIVRMKQRRICKKAHLK